MSLSLRGYRAYHQPYSEQQSPNSDPMHVTPPPHNPSMETIWVDDGAADEAVVGTVAVDMVDGIDVDDA
jgi:hypothetical protein